MTPLEVLFKFQVQNLVKKQKYASQKCGKVQEDATHAS